MTSYPHMCRADHVEVGYRDEIPNTPEELSCPVCFERSKTSEAVGLLREVERVVALALKNEEDVGQVLNLEGTMDTIRRFLAAQESK